MMTVEETGGPASRVLARLRTARRRRTDLRSGPRFCWTRGDSTKPRGARVEGRSMTRAAEQNQVSQMRRAKNDNKGRRDDDETVGTESSATRASDEASVEEF